MMTPWEILMEPMMPVRMRLMPMMLFLKTDLNRGIHMKRVLIISLLITLKINAQTTIGWEESCDYNMNVDANSLQQAIDDGMTELRLSNENSFEANPYIQADIIIEGGYNNCSDASAGLKSATNTTIDGSSAVLPVIRFGFYSSTNTQMDHLTLINGTGQNGNELVHSGGMGIRDVTGYIGMNHIIIETNNGYNGAGMSVYAGFSAEPTLLTVDINDSIIRQNNAINYGGGLSCTQTGEVAKISINLNNGSSINPAT
jgi:hypothetical protein